jgi:hypothetical protein
MLFTLPLSHPKPVARERFLKRSFVPPYLDFSRYRSEESSDRKTTGELRMAEFGSAWR